MELGPVHSNIVTSEAFEHLVTLLAELTEAGHPDEAAGLILEHGMAALAAQSAALCTVDADRRRLELRTHRNASPETVAAFPLDLDLDVPVAEAARTGMPLWIDTAEERDRWYPLLAGSPVAVRSSAVLPIQAAGVIVGAVALGFAGDHPFSETERAFSLALADLAALATFHRPT